MTAGSLGRMEEDKKLDFLFSSSPRWSEGCSQWSSDWQWINIWYYKMGITGKPHPLGEGPLGSTSPGAGKDFVPDWSGATNVFSPPSCRCSQRGNVFLCVPLPGVRGSRDGKNCPHVDLLVIEQRDWAREPTTPVWLGCLIGPSLKVLNRKPHEKSARK